MINLYFKIEIPQSEDTLWNGAGAVKRIKEIQKLPDTEKDKTYSVIDALVRDFKTKQAYK